MAIYCARFETLDDESFQTLRQGLITYVQSEYIYGPAEVEAPCESDRASCGH